MKLEDKYTEIKIPTEVFSRVSGYFRPVNQWNKGKQEEFLDRTYLKMNCISNQNDNFLTDCSSS